MGRFGVAGLGRVECAAKRSSFSLAESFDGSQVALRPGVAVVRKILFDVDDGFAEGDEEFFHVGTVGGDDVF